MSQPVPRYAASPFAKEVHRDPAPRDPIRGLSQDEQEALSKKLIEGFMQLVVQAVAGAFVPGGPSAFQQLSNWAKNTPGLRDFVQLLTNGQDLDQWIKEITSGHGMFSEDHPVNMQRAQNFPPGSIANPKDWVVNLSSSRTNDGSGCARVVADGRVHALRSGKDVNDTIPVSPGGTLTSEVYVRHSGYQGSGFSVLLQAVPYRDGVPQAPVTIAAYRPGPSPVTWPGILIKGTYPPINDPIFGGTNTEQPTIAAGITGAQTRLVVTEQALAGVFDFDDGFTSSPVKVKMTSVAGLTEALREARAFIQGVIDTALSALYRTPVVGGSLPQLLHALGVIPSTNVQGAGGPATMSDSVFAIIDAWLSGAVGVPGATGGNLADVINVSGEVSSNAMQGAYAWQVVNKLNNTPVAPGMLPTGRANYYLTSANTFLATTQSAALSASFGLLQSMSIGVISWYGYGSSGLTAFYVNIRRVDPVTGVRTLVHHSTNIVGNLQPGSTPGDANWMFYQLPIPIAGKAEDKFYVELVPVGGTHNVRGMSFSDNIKDHPVATSPCYGTTVDYGTSAANPPFTLPKATSGPNVAWLEFAVSLGVVADPREPLIVTFGGDGESIPIPSWCDRVDGIALGQGGAGHDGPGAGFAGEPGHPGSFGSTTWVRGVDFPATGTTFVSFSILPNGDAKIFIPGKSIVGAAGASGAASKFGSNPVGLGAGTLPYQGQNYSGGVDQRVTGGAGTNPGGGGNGGGGLFPQAGGLGGRAAGWACFRQVNVTGDVGPADTTPPTAPTNVHLDSASQSSLTISWTGATDS